MAVTLGSPPLADFSRPIQFLKDCHRRIEHFLSVMRTLTERSDGGDLDDECRRALEASLKYFREAAPRHTADEEESLFPRLRRSGSAEARQVMAALDRLEADHRTVEAALDRIRELGSIWLKVGHLDKADRSTLKRLLDELAIAYAAHIRLEDEDVFAIAARVLTQHDLCDIGAEMKRRRRTPSGQDSGALQRKPGKLASAVDEEKL